ncbi:MAG: lipopolysaccharide core heptose(I) kinase RfaP [Piscirickettsiaceae bacterium]|nr:MAG: lipopolysaccharide core heptose(I) kinase RfaP [Piscirickettsiaceae bacterium]
MQFEVSDEFGNAWEGTPSFDELMSLDGEMYRQVARRKTFKFDLNGMEYFAKIHNGVGWQEIFKNLIQGRLPVIGAKNEYDAINTLTKLGISTMTLAAFGQRGSNIAELESFVITRSLEPATSLEDFCADWDNVRPPVLLKRALIKRVAAITRELHNHGLNHRDLYICHFLLKDEDVDKVVNVDELPLYLIDLHRVQIRDKVPERWLIKDLAALYFSSMNIGFTRRDFYRFVREYTGVKLKEVFAENQMFWAKVEKKALYLNAKHK